MPYATVTRNMAFGPRIEYKQQDSKFEGRATISTASSRSGGHVELGARLTLTERGTGGDGGVMTTANGDVPTDSAVSYRVGLGVTSGGGIKDDSATVKILGTGITVGRRVGLSFFDTEIGIDVYKIRNPFRNSSRSESPEKSPSEQPL